MSAPPRAPLVVLAALIAGVLCSACGVIGGYTDAGPAADRPVATGSPTPAAVGTLGPGFWDPDNPPPPEGTLRPAPRSWIGVRPPSGYSVTLVVDGVPSRFSRGTNTLRYAVQAWAAQYGVQLQEVVARQSDRYVASLQEAIDSHPDLVVVAGHGLVDPLALVSAPNLETQFLVVGAEIAEPTANVTAVDWTGAGFRGEGLGLPDDFDPASFTPERASDAVAAGSAAVLSGITGIVVLL